MSDKQTDKLDAFTSKMVKESKQEKPSINFSKNVMNEIYAFETEKVLKKNQPLISNKVWLFLISIIGISTFYLFEKIGISQSSFFSKIDLSNYLSFDLNLGFTVSSVTIYAFVFLAIMVSVQIGYIKNYYNRQFE